MLAGTVFAVGLRVLHPAAPRLLSLTLRRLSHCVVAVLDRCAESMEAAELLE